MSDQGCSHAHNMCLTYIELTKNIDHNNLLLKLLTWLDVNSSLSQFDYVLSMSTWSSSKHMDVLCITTVIMSRACRHNLPQNIDWGNQHRQIYLRITCVYYVIKLKRKI
jgi:hypothetical protein